MNGRIRKYLEGQLGFDLESMPTAGIHTRASASRSTKSWNRVKAFRIGDGAVITCIPELLTAVTRAVASMTVSELFSPVGEAELRRAVAPGADGELFHGLSYVLSDRECLRQVSTPHTPRALRKADLPATQRELRMSERRQPVKEDFIWAFGCYRDREGVRATDFTEFGQGCVSIAIIMWNEGHGVATFGVGTHEDYRGRGYALANVTAATQYILQEGGVAHYEAAIENLPSLRLARRLGFSCEWQEIRL